jgi:hypothetical protein
LSPDDTHVCDHPQTGVLSHFLVLIHCGLEEPYLIYSLLRASSVIEILRPLKGHFYIVTFSLCCFHWLIQGSVSLLPAPCLYRTLFWCHASLYPQTIWLDGRQHSHYWYSHLMWVGVMCFILRYIRFLLTTFKEGAGRGLLRLAGTCDT